MTPGEVNVPVRQRLTLVPYKTWWVWLWGAVALALIAVGSSSFHSCGGPSPL